MSETREFKPLNELGTLSLSETTQIKFYVDEYKGYKYGSIRTFIQGESYSGPTKSGITMNAALLDGVIPVLQKLPKEPDTSEDKELARFPKKAGVQLVLRITIFRDTTGVDLREWVEDSSYKGWSKKGVRIPYKELSQAYEVAQRNFDPKAVNRVILMTDGDFNVGVADPAKLTDFVVEKRKTGVYLSVYGFGGGNYNDTLMQALAQNGNGTAGYIDTLSEARKAFRDDFSGSLFPIADDVKIQVEFNPAQVSEYRLIGYETRLLNREDFNNDKVDAGEVGSGTSVTALYEITPAGAQPSSDPLRYGQSMPAASTGAGDEIAFLKVRYKLPGQSDSHLISRPIGKSDVAQSASSAPEATRWALAVAGFSQKLRHDPWVLDRFGWKQIYALADSAKGDDPFALRAEFLSLVRAAEGPERGE